MKIGTVREMARKKSFFNSLSKSDFISAWIVLAALFLLRDEKSILYPASSIAFST
jgi:hypothetical protein